jgi:leukotriene-A4 hydrolase
LQYFEKFKGKSLDSYEFKSTVLDFFSSDEAASNKLAGLDWSSWFYKPGYPPKPAFDTSLVDICYSLAEKWELLSAGKDESYSPDAKDIGGWSANQSVVFLERVQNFKKPLPSRYVQLMGDKYGYSKSQNVELVSRYFSIGLKARYEAVYAPVAGLLGKVGRMKFVRPLYRLLKEADRDLAVETFKRNKDFYHPICRAMVEKDLFGDA